MFVVFANIVVSVISVTFVVPVVVVKLVIGEGLVTIQSRNFNPCNMCNHCNLYNPCIAPIISPFLVVVKTVISVVIVIFVI